MSDAPRWRRYLRFARPNVVADVDDELAFHVTMRTERNVSLGMTPDEARREALARFGDPDLVRGELVAHDRRRETAARHAEYVADLVQDLRFGARALRRAPGFAVAAILTLGLGIGANAAIFSVVNAVLLRPLPYAHPEQLVSAGSGSAGEYLALRERLRSVASFAAWVPQTHPVDDGSQTFRLEGAAVTTNLFATLGVSPMLGRGFADSNAVFGQNAVVILSHRLWQRMFGGSPDAIGKQLRIEGVPQTVIGVMAEDFQFPSVNVEYWQPYAFNLANPGIIWAVQGKQFIGRLAPGTTVDQASRELREVWPTLRRLNPLWDPGDTYRTNVAMAPLQDNIVGSSRSTLWILFACVVVVLLIGCVNVANLLLSRATVRERELAVRAAVGGGRARLIRQLVTESLLLSVVGAALGIGIAYVAVNTLVAAIPAGVPRTGEVAVNGGVLLFTALVAVVTAVVFGVVPALRATRFARQGAAGPGLRATAGASHHRISGLLVAGEVALAVVLVIASALLVRSFGALRGVNPGFDTDRVIAARVTLPASDYSDPARVSAFFEDVIGRVGALPGVQTVGTVDKLPLAQSVWGLAVRVAGQFEDASRLLPMVNHYQSVSPGYFATMRVPLLRGRAFAESDRENQLPVTVVSQSVVRRFWPDDDPIGKRIGYPYESPWLTVVGVVPDTKQDSLRDTTSMSIYVPWRQRSQMSGTEAWIVARTAGDPASLAGAIRSVVHDADRATAVSDVRTMQAVVADSMDKTRFVTLLVAAFALTAIFLGAIGIYGVMAYLVGQRTREMGVRIALGAQPGAVIRLVLFRSLWIAAGGVLVGGLAALAVTRSLNSLLYGVSATDPITFVTVPILFLLVAVAASFAPARRATRIDPVRALRAD